MPTIAHCIPSYRYGGGFYVYIANLPTFFAKSIKVAREIASSHGCDLVRC